MQNRLTFPVILEYCGGLTTDFLYEKLQKWNPEYKIYVLDNCSPNNRSKYITHRNKVNSYVGGGIKDCVKLTRSYKHKYLLYIVNDIEFLNQLDIFYLESLIEKDSDIVQIGISTTPDSNEASHYTWMVNRGNKENRFVHHCDLLCCMIKISFLDEFGGFPESKSGWGYDWELGYQARLRRKKILITDKFICRHRDETNKQNYAFGPQFDKEEELRKVYNARYGDYTLISPLNKIHNSSLKPIIVKLKTFIQTVFKFSL